MQANQNPFDDPQVAGRYEAWYSGPGRRTDRVILRLKQYHLFAP
jgi:hypothetical protein